MLRGIRAVVVDLDGTMVDTLGDFEVALNLTLAELDLPEVDRTLVEHTVGKGSEHLIRSVLAHQLALPEVAARPHKGSARTVDALYALAWQRYQDHYHRINGQHSAVYPGVVEGLKALGSMGLKLACLTNKPLAFAQGLLKVKALDGHFAWVFGGDSFERKKPDPMPLWGTCAAMAVDPSQALMVGDSENDARAARAASCPVALVTYGYNHGEPVAAVSHDVLLGSLADLPGYLA